MSASTSPLKGFRILWVGQLLSSIGSPFQAIAIAIWTLDSGRGANALAVVIAVGTISQLLGTLISGPLVDRWGALTIILHCDIVRCALASVLAAALFLKFDTFIIVGIVATSGVIGGIFLPALRSSPGILLEKKDQPRANSLMEVSASSSMLIGALAGGLMVAFTGPVAAIIFNASSFAIGAISAASVRRQYSEGSPRGATDSILKLVREGLIFVWQTRWLRTMLLVDAVLDLVTAG